MASDRARGRPGVGSAAGFFGRWRQTSAVSVEEAAAGGRDPLCRPGRGWTLVYPVLLTDGPHTGAYRSGEQLEIEDLARISRADVADFMLSQLQDPTYSRTTVTVVSGR